MTDETNNYLNNIGAILELYDVYMAHLIKGNNLLAVLKETNNVDNTDSVAAQAEESVRINKAYFAAAKKVIQDTYHLTADELRQHAIDIQTAIKKSTELTQHERILTRTFELLVESGVIEDETIDYDPGEPSTWSRKHFEGALTNLRHQIDLNMLYIRNKMKSPQNKVLLLPREG